MLLVFLMAVTGFGLGAYSAWGGLKWDAFPRMVVAVMDTALVGLFIGFMVAEYAPTLPDLDLVRVLLVVIPIITAFLGIAFGWFFGRRDSP